MDQLENRIKELYGRKKLSDQQLKQLLNQKVSSRPQKKTLQLTVFALAASLMLVFGYYFGIHPEIQKNRIIKAYAEEVAYNHLKESAPKIYTDQTSSLNEQLSKLNFEVTFDERLQRYGNLIGGKYCHIDDQIAAQLRIEDKDSNPLTCYQFKQQYNHQFDQSINTKGVTVHLWTKDEVVIAIAETSSRE